MQLLPANKTTGILTYDTSSCAWECSTPQSGIYSFIHDGELDCFLEDRRLLSGQLESRSNDAWPPTRVVQRELEVGHSIVDRKRVSVPLNQFSKYDQSA